MRLLPDLTEAWWDAVAAVLDAPGTVVMLGAVDAGKTTAAVRLANAALRAGRRTAVVDLDTGQSSLGPPATVSLGLPGRPVRRMSEIPRHVACFIGDTSPRGTYRFLVEGAVRLVTRARAHAAEVIIVDTTGWISGPAAVSAKAAKIRQVAPRHVIAIQRADELEPILARIAGDIAVHRLRPSRHARPRSREERRAYREQRFGRYLAHAGVHRVRLTRVSGERTIWYAGRGISPARVPAEIPPQVLRHLLVALADSKGWMRALGTVAASDPAGNCVDVLAPLDSLTGVRQLQWGTLRVAPSGREEGRLPDA